MLFAKETIDNIDTIFQQAYDDGRDSLYEFEVYKVLAYIGISVPKFIFVNNPEQLKEDDLKLMGREVMVKIVSPQIAHKQKLGGVKRVTNHDPLFVQYIMTRMKQEVLSHFDVSNLPEIKGFLIVEVIPFSQGLGYEVLFGLKEDAAFGPVLTLSKGGDDAEFFAKYFDPANLFLPPLELNDTRELVCSLKIRHKFSQLGHPEYVEYMAQAGYLLSRLAYEYSFVNKNNSRFIIKEMDINPVVITKDSRFVAIDGFARFTPVGDPSYKGAQTVKTKNLQSFFKPNGIAVIGVSADWDKYSLGREIACLLHDLGREDIYFVNNKGGSITFHDKEYTLYSTIEEIPQKLELAVYAASAKFTIDFFKQLNIQCPKSVILISGIPSDTKYSEFASLLSEVVPEGCRVVGPNCMGVFYAPDETTKGINTLFLNEERLNIKYCDMSNTVFLTQSGALAVTAIDKFQHAKVFKSIVSFGNKYDVKVTDLMEYFSNDTTIDVISIYLEGLDYGEGRDFFELAKNIKKPIIAYKSGKTEAGAKAAASHTASLSGSYDVFKAACEQSGVILSEKIEDQYDYIKAFSLLAKKVPKGNRVAGVVNAGFESTVGADELKVLTQAQLSPSTIEYLNTINSHGLVDTHSPFLDLTPMADDKMYADYTEAVLKDDNVDCVFVSVVPHAIALKTTPDTCHDEGSLAKRLIALNKKYNKPIIVSVNAGQYYQEFVTLMEKNGLPVYTDIRSCIKSLDRFVEYHIGRQDCKL